MRRADKMICQAAVLLLLFSLSSAPARAQLAGFGAEGGGGDMMTQMAPMLEMMKAKMGKRRFAILMQTMGPMMSRMMENGGFSAMTGGSGFGGGYMPAGMDMGSFGCGDITGMMGGAGSDMMAMIPQLMSLADIGGGSVHHRRRKHR